MVTRWNHRLAPVSSTRRFRPFPSEYAPTSFTVRTNAAERASRLRFVVVVVRSSIPCVYQLIYHVYVDWVGFHWTPLDIKVAVSYLNQV